MALELLYRVENRSKSSGAPALVFPRPPQGRAGPGSGPKSTIPVLPPIPRKQPKNTFDCIGVEEWPVNREGTAQRLERSRRIGPFHAKGRIETVGLNTKTIPTALRNGQRHCTQVRACHHCT